MYVLGIAHDLVISSACLIKNGKIIFAISEERLNRIKQYKGFPRLSIEACLNFAKIKFSDLDRVSIGWNPLNTMSYPSESWSKVSRNRMEYLYSIPNHLSYFKKFINIDNLEQNLYNKGPKITYHNHQLCHAAGAFYQSGFKESAILTLDGTGERTTGLLACAKQNKIETISEIEYPNSLGLFYASLTQFLGFKAESDEWKVMALGAYSSKIKNPYIKKFEKFYSYDNLNNKFNLNMEYFTFPYPETNHGLFFSENLIKLIGEPRKTETKLSKKHYSIAYALQYHFEKIMMFFLDDLYLKYPSKNLVLSGGCIMNCKFNGEIKKKSKFDNIYIPSAPDDSGISIGCSMLSYANSTKFNNKNLNKITSNYWGNSYSNTNISNTLNSYKLNYRKSKNLSDEISILLKNSKLIGWFQGRSEFGQRSLGNRSILADPRKKNIKDIVNKSIKFREKFRPFAPAILDYCFEDFFETDGEGEINFMEKTKNFKKNKINLVKGVVHQDGSGRVQTVSKNYNKKFYELIQAFFKKTSIPILLNTSFNLNGEPIVETPDDAIRTFYNCGLDYLVIEDFIISK